MQLGISTYTFGWNIGRKDAMPSVRMNESDLITVACRHGIKLIQLGDNLPFHSFTIKRCLAMTAALENQHMEVQLGARRMTPVNLKKYILLSAEINASLLRFLVDDRFFKPDLKEIEKIIRSQLPLLQDKNVALALENHDRLKAEELAALIENVGSKQVGICLDTANSFGVGEGIETVMKRLAPYTLNLHLKDITVKRLSHQMGFKMEGRPAGKGMLDIPGLINQLKKYKKCKSAILEQWTVPEDTLEKTIEKERKWATISLNYLKPLFHNHMESGKVKRHQMKLK